jgi:hypothetical protein
MNPIEYLGISASVMVVISFLFKSPKWIRAVNIIGALLFIIYGYLISAWSVVICNFILLIIQTVYLLNIMQKEKENRK